MAPTLAPAWAERGVLRSPHPQGAVGQPTRRCWTCATEVPISRYRSETLRQLGWQLCKTHGHAQEYVPWPEADGYWRMVPVLG